MGAIENIPYNARFVHVLCPVAHLFRMLSVRQHSLQPRDDGKIVKVFARPSIGPTSCFLAVGTFGQILIRSNEANTAIYATAVSYTPKSSKRPNTLLGKFQGFMT